MGTILIVDGYNIIGSWPELKVLKKSHLGSAREQLAATLSAYYPWCWERIIIVYDGQRYDWEDVEGLEIVFTENRETADTMIERLAAGLATFYRVEVATSDRAEYRAASGLGARVISAPALKELLAEHRCSYSGRLTDPAAKKGLLLNNLLDARVVDSLERLRRYRTGP